MVSQDRSTPRSSPQTHTDPQFKIDQSFVRDIDSDLNDPAITNAIIAMAQGYYFGKPVPTAQIHPDCCSACTNSEVDAGN